MRTRLVEFVGALRAAGLAPSPAETLDALAAVATAGVEREVLREALAATLVKDQADRPRFDRVFEAFFALPRRRGQAAGARRTAAEGAGTGRPSPGGIPGVRPRTGGEPERPGDRRAPDEREEVERERRRAGEREDAGERLAAARALRAIPFEAMDPVQVEACERLVEELARRFRAHLRRRLRLATRGRLDLRRTFRRSVATGGTPVDPAFRFRRPGQPDVVALCDVSHSVATASRFFVALLLPARQYFRHVRVFAFVDEPVEVSCTDGHLVPHGPLDLYARSDFGRVLERLWERHAPLFTRNTILLVLGDARNNRRPPRADLLGRLRPLVRRVVWLNPEPPARWDTGDSVMRTYARFCDVVLPASDLRQLEAALRTAFRRP